MESKKQFHGIGFQYAIHELSENKSLNNRITFRTDISKKILFVVTKILFREKFMTRIFCPEKVEQIFVRDKSCKRTKKTFLVRTFVPKIRYCPGAARRQIFGKNINSMEE